MSDNAEITQEETKAEPMTAEDITARLFGDDKEPAQEASETPVEAPEATDNGEDIDVSDLLTTMGVETSQEAADGQEPEQEQSINIEDSPLIDGVDEETVKSMNEKQGAAFREYRVRVKELERQLKEVQESKPSVSTEEVEQWKKKYEEADALVQKTNLTESNWFKQTYREPIKQKAMEINALGKELGVKPEILAQAGKQPSLGAQIRFLEKNINSSTAKTLLATEFTSLNKLAKEAHSAVENWQQTRQKAEAEDTYSHNQEVSQLQDKFVDNAVAELSQQSLLMKEMKNDQWTSLRNQRIERARDLIRGGDVAQQTQAVIKGVYADELEKMFLAEREKRMKLEADIGKFKKASPNVGNTSVTNGGGKKEVDLDNIGQVVVQNLLNKRRRV